MGENPRPYSEYDIDGKKIVDKITTPITWAHREDVPQEEGGLPPVEMSTYSKERSTTRPIAENLLGKKAELIKKEFSKNNNKYEGGIDLPKKKFGDYYKGNA